MFCTTIAPFRVAEGEQTAEQCAPKDADGWMAYLSTTINPAPVFYYRTKREACLASEALEVGVIPSFGQPFWPGATRY